MEGEKTRGDRMTGCERRGVAAISIGLLMTGVNTISRCRSFQSLASNKKFVTFIGNNAADSSESEQIVA